MAERLIGSLSKRQRTVLLQMSRLKHEVDGELVYERGLCFLGDERVAPRTLFALLRLCAISLSQDSHVGGFERYTINSTGEGLLRGAPPPILKPRR